jgi:hypothetical protein
MREWLETAIKFIGIIIVVILGLGLAALLGGYLLVVFGLGIAAAFVSWAFGAKINITQGNKKVGYVQWFTYHEYPDNS